MADPRAPAWMRMALRLATRAYGRASPNPMVGAVLVKRGEIIGRGWHRGAGAPHAEVEALRDAARTGHSPRGATLYVTLEPCCTHGRTPPCTDAIIRAGLKHVVAATTDPNPRHAGRGFDLLRKAGIAVTVGTLERDAADLNAPFNHWIIHRRPLVTVKAAMSLDGKIATRTGESKWITSPRSRAIAMRLRHGSDAILVGINTVVADDPALTLRAATGRPLTRKIRQPWRIVLDPRARIPLRSRLVTDEHAGRTIVVVSQRTPEKRIAALQSKCTVWAAPGRRAAIDLNWLLQELGKLGVLSLLVEGGGEVNSSFLFGEFAHRIAFFYAPKLIGGGKARKGVGGAGVTKLEAGLQLESTEWSTAGPDLLLSARVRPSRAASPGAKRG